MSAFEQLSKLVLEYNDSTDSFEETTKKVVPLYQAWIKTLKVKDTELHFWQSWMYDNNEPNYSIYYGSRWDAIHFFINYCDFDTCHCEIVQDFLFSSCPQFDYPNLNVKRCNPQDLNVSRINSTEPVSELEITFVKKILDGHRAIHRNGNSLNYTFYILDIKSFDENSLNVNYNISEDCTNNMNLLKI